MRKTLYLTIILVFFIAAMGCSGINSSHHKNKMPDPSAFNAHFGDMDTDGDDQVSWEEFKAHFPEATMDIYKEIDLDKNNMVDHDEWHEFKEAHGLKHVE